LHPTVLTLFLDTVDTILFMEAMKFSSRTLAIEYQRKRTDEQDEPRVIFSLAPTPPPILLRNPNPFIAHGYPSATSRATDGATHATVTQRASNGCVPPLAAPGPRRLPPLRRLLLAIVVVRPQGEVRRPPLRVRFRPAASQPPRYPDPSSPALPKLHVVFAS
jgi:hypothetical protein